MDIKDFLERLKGVAADGKGGWMACCPAHDDHNPSMHVAVGDDGRILVKCFAGCSAEAIVAAMGLTLKDLMPDGDRAGSASVAVHADGGMDVATAIKAPKGKRDYGQLVCAYDYQDETGNVIYRVERRMMANGKKTFIQLHPDPTSRYGWAWGVSKAGVKRVPFRLPRVLAAAKAGKSVIVCEGEKDVLTIERTLGVAATCNAGGAGKWESGWGKYFERASTVCIIADKDPYKKRNRRGEEEVFAVGQRHACDVEAKLRADGFKGGIRKIFVPDVGSTKCKDYTDWVEAVEKTGGKVDKAAFQSMLAAFDGWPSEWEFGASEAGAIAHDRKAVGESGDDAPGADGRGCGRFGRLVPRAPVKSQRVYEVDFRIDADRTIRFEVGMGYFRTVPFVKSDGKYRIYKTYRPMTDVSLTGMFAMAIGNCLDNQYNPGGKFGTSQKSELQSIVTLLWLRSRGKFFWDEDAKGFATSLYFDELTGVLMRVRSDEFMAFVATESEINRESSTFKYMMSLLDDAAISASASQGVVPSNLWDRKGDNVYVSSGDSEMYRISGGNVTLVQNGTDGVVFMRGKTLAPWKLMGDGIDPFEKSLLFNCASWASASGRMNVRLWVLNLFACHAMKPILLLTGAMRSGKTRMAKGIKEILGVRQDGKLDMSVQQVEDGDRGLDAFWATVNSGKFEVYDNVDTKAKWLSDTLQNVATDGQTKRRTLYTTFGVSILRANAHLVLTSNNPTFATEGNGGMADRLISVHLATGREMSLDTELSDDIRSHRNEFLTWIVRIVAKAMLDTSPVDESINRRHPDYGRFSIRCGRAFGDERGVIEAMGSAEADKSLLPMLNDVVMREVINVLAERDPKWVMRFTSGEMSEAILKRFGDDDSDDKSCIIYGARRVGKTLSKYERQFNVIFKCSKRLLDGKTLYEVGGLTAAGEMAFGGQVGEVGFKGSFPQDAQVDTKARGFAESNPSNPLDPLHAHARAGDSSFSSLKEEEDKENGGDDGFVW